MRGVILTALVLATLAGGAGWWPAPPPEARPLADGRVDAVDTPASAAPARPPVAGVIAEDAAARREPAPPAPAETAPPLAGGAPRVAPAAAASLARARRDGDPRTPPLAPAREARAAPPPEVLEDPVRYRRYEQGERMAVYASFLAASQRKIRELETLVARGEREGLPAEQLAEGRRKLEGLKARRRELGERYPELTAPPPEAPDGAG
ncbi:MAG: hypothetical protein ABGX87_13520 [Alcanivorax sp.]|uniref:Uncharacterized protein n=2 Tax=Alloalcanivorax marinus TaxID=1177169 RepID=A0A9Q3UL55_9GAMM|nr:hypothetical protein [Alloalcanivorax marinus]MCC4308036.1 hypothetical protein [Alloalcanivorax marinus]